MAVVAGSRSFRTESYADVHPPDNNGAYEDQVVPALRKRLEEESRALAKRMSIHSLLVSEASVQRVQSDSEAQARPVLTNPPSPNTTDNVPGPSSFTRKRTYSTPYPFDPTVDSPRPTPEENGPSRKTSEALQNDRPSSPRSRIPKPSGRVVSASNATRKASPLASSRPSLLEDDHGSSFNGTSLDSTSQDDLRDPPPQSKGMDELQLYDTRAASESHARNQPEEFELWYRGEGRDGGGRNGGRGEITAGAHELLKIAMGGHTIRSAGARPDSFRLEDKLRSRRERLQDGDWVEEYVLNEQPLTDMEVDGELTDVDTLGAPRSPSRISPLLPDKSIPKSHIHPIMPSSSRIPTPQSLRAVSTPIKTASNRSTTSSSAMKTHAKTNSPSTIKTRTRVRKKSSLPTVSPNQASRSTYDLSSVSALADAVPRWDNQLLPPSGNWDEVILPTVAKKLRMATEESTKLDIWGASSKNPDAPPSSEPPPAPGTFAYDASKVRRFPDAASFLPKSSEPSSQTTPVSDYAGIHKPRDPANAVTPRPNARQGKKAGHHGGGCWARCIVM